MRNVWSKALLPFNLKVGIENKKIMPKSSNAIYPFEIRRALGYLDYPLPSVEILDLLSHRKASECQYVAERKFDDFGHVRSWVQYIRRIAPETIVISVRLDRKPYL